MNKMRISSTAQQDVNEYKKEKLHQANKGL